jgi:hypothetical protein
MKKKSFPRRKNSLQELAAAWETVSQTPVATLLCLVALASLAVSGFALYVALALVNK